MKLIAALLAVLAVVACAIALTKDEAVFNVTALVLVVVAIVVVTAAFVRSKPESAEAPRSVRRPESIPLSWDEEEVEPETVYVEVPSWESGILLHFPITRATPNDPWETSFPMKDHPELTFFRQTRHDARECIKTCARDRSYRRLIQQWILAGRVRRVPATKKRSKA